MRFPSSRRSEGKGPLRRLDLRLKICRADKRLRVFEGRVPSSPTAGNRTAITLELSELQVTPVQLVQAETLKSQFSFLEWVMLLTKSSRARLSSTGSDVASEQRVRQTNIVGIIILMILISSILQAYSLISAISV